MGVPRLYKMLVERYPLIMRGAQEPPVPEFDNFYIDFNGKAKVEECVVVMVMVMVRYQSDFFHFISFSIALCQALFTPAPTMEQKHCKILLRFVC